MAAARCSSAVMEFGVASSVEHFCETHVNMEAKVFYKLALNEPLPRGRFSNKYLFACGDRTYTTGEMVPRVVLQAEGYDLSKDFMYDDVAKCLALLELIHLKAGEPDKSISKTDRDILYTDAYGWILSQTDYWTVGAEKATEFTNFLLDYTEFDSVNTMRDFIDIVYLPVEFLAEKVISREKEFKMGILINDGLRLDSPTVQRYIAKELGHQTRRLRFARMEGDTLEFNDSMILINRLMTEFAPEDSSRPEAERDVRYCAPYFG
jgi:hypothetical protein